MGIKLELPKITDLRPRLTVIGVGGAGCNAVNNMIAAGLTGVEFVVANTDAQALAASSAEHRIQLGINLTEGLGAGSRPEIGEAAAEEAIDEIRGQIAGAHMLFIAAGMGGGTGTGAAAVIARTAKELGVLTVGIVTKPFQFEGTRRQRIAEAGIAELKAQVDTLIVIPNQNLFRVANERTTFAEAFVLADQVLYSGVACIVDLIVKEGLINLDFADVRTIMSGMGSAMMGTGEAAGDRRAIVAAEEAIANPLLDDVTLKGAKGLLLSITGGRDLTLYEVDEAASRVRAEVDAEANIIVGATFDESLGDRVRVSIVASGMARSGAEAGRGPSPATADSWPRPRQQDATIPVEPPAAAVQPSAAGIVGAHDLQRRLSDAMQYGQPVAAPVPEPPPREPAGSPPRETWRAPGNVLIEEGPPPLHGHVAGNPSELMAGFGEPAYARAPSAPDTFVPAPAADVRRRMPRLPEIDEFPAVGQREFRAKAPHYSAATQPPASQRQAHTEQDSGNRRASLFQRLTGLGRRGGDDSDDSSRTAFESGRAAAPVRDSDARPEAARVSPGGSRPGPQSAPRSAKESVDLPVFFNRERR
jgi:cell division protein FtsZ